jgi:hypothetical protein
MLYSSTQDIFPQQVRNLSKHSIHPVYSQHALNAKSDRYGTIELPETITFSGENVFEVEIENNRVTKMAVRLPYKNDCDLCVVFLMGSGFVKTVWLNKHEDTHKTLNLSKYSSH